MFPELFRVGDFAVTSFGVMMALAFFAGYQVIRSELKRLGRDPDIAADILLGALIGGIVGAKIYYVLLNWDRTSIDPFGMIFARSGLVWYGGFFGGAAGVLFMAVRRKLPIPTAMDAAAPALALSYAIGRLGCFLVGDDYGRPTDSPVGIAFPDGLPPTTAGNLRRFFGVEIPAGVPDGQVLAVHPTQLYEVGMSLLIFFILMTGRVSRTLGWLFGLWLMFAASEWFTVEC